MPRARPTALYRFGRGTRATGALLRPAVPFALAAGTLTLGAGFVIDRLTEYRRQGHPPAQTIPVDLDPTRPGPESLAIFDPATGSLLSYGTPPTHEGAPLRSQEREIKFGLLAAGVVAVAAIVVVAGGK
jgi:hypothetical protein